jgi:hypothetical protein
MTIHEAAKQSRRSVVEQRLELQADFLKRIIALLEKCTPWPHWPSAELAILAGAISADISNAVEARKARDLKWHLFRGNLPAWSIVRLDGFQDVEDRVRADLSGLVPLGIGRVIQSKGADARSSSP